MLNQQPDNRPDGFNKKIEAIERNLQEVITDEFAPILLSAGEIESVRQIINALNDRKLFIGRVFSNI